MTQIRWLERLTLVLLHAESLSKYGGLAGMRDEGLLEGALARPRNLHAYEEVDDIVTLAACYGVAVARNHPFNDGNKRAAFIAALTFARLNGVTISADQTEAAAIMVAVASNEMGQAELAAWFLKNVGDKRE